MHSQERRDIDVMLLTYLEHVVNDGAGQRRRHPIWTHATQQHRLREASVQFLPIHSVHARPIASVRRCRALYCNRLCWRRCNCLPLLRLCDWQLRVRGVGLRGSPLRLRAVASEELLSGSRGYGLALALGANGGGGL